MKTLNFLPDWYREQLQRRARARRRTTWLVLVVAAAGCWSGLQQVRIVRAEGRLAALRAQHQLQTPMVDQAVWLRKTLLELDSEHTLYADLCGGAKLHQIFAELADRLPASVVLEGLEIDRGPRLQPAGEPETKSNEPTPPNTLIRGYAVRAADVGRLVNELTKSPVFEDVVLKYAQPTEVDGHALRGFEIQGQVPQFE